MRVCILVQARFNSTRLPGKVCKELNGLPILYHIYRRMLACREAQQVVVSYEGAAQISNVCIKYGMYGFQGPETDLLLRHKNTAIQCHADAIVRITADCVFHDPKWIDWQIGQFRLYWPRERGRSMWPYRTRSEGLDFEIWTLDLLEELSRNPECPREDFAAWVCNDTQRAHDFQMMLGVRFAKDEGDPHLSIDTQEDFDRAERMLKILGNDEWNYEKTLKAYRKCI